jgi:hypothetical protein
VLIAGVYYNTLLSKRKLRLIDAVFLGYVFVEIISVCILICNVRRSGPKTRSCSLRVVEYSSRGAAALISLCRGVILVALYIPGFRIFKEPSLLRAAYVLVDLIGNLTNNRLLINRELLS